MESQIKRFKESSDENTEKINELKKYLSDEIKESIEEIENKNL